MNANMKKLEGTKRHVKHTAMIAAPLLLMLTALGCSEQKRTATAQVAAEEPTAGVAQTTATTASTQQPVEPAPAEVGSDLGAPADALPPDIVATAPDTLAVPGSVLVLTALGSSDVTSVVLTDANGGKTPFVFDSESNLWRVSYRVPMKAVGERIGLSVTATTETNRWKRVWIFLNVRGNGTESESGC